MHFDPVITVNNLAVGADGVLYVADTNNHVIRRVAGSTVSTVAGVLGIAGSLGLAFTTPVAVVALAACKNMLPT